MFKICQNILHLNKEEEMLNRIRQQKQLHLNLLLMLCLKLLKQSQTMVLLLLKEEQNYLVKMLLMQKQLTQLENQVEGQIIKLLKILFYLLNLNQSLMLLKMKQLKQLKNMVLVLMKNILKVFLKQLKVLILELQKLQQT